jgi:RPA family protein
MDRSEVTDAIGKKLSLRPEEASIVVNEILALRVVPDLFRTAAVERIVSLSSLNKDKAELAVNEFVSAVTARASIFEEVISGFIARGIDDSCRSCDGCRNCGKEAFLPAIDVTAARG